MKNSNLPTPHDRLFKAALQHPEVVREFLSSHLPDNVLKNINFKSITVCSNTFIDDELKLSASDVLLECLISDQKGYIYVLCEHQSTQDELMPFRLLKYLTRIWDYHQNKTKKGKLPFPVIFPLVFYTGKGSYNKPRSIWELCGSQSELMRAILQQPFHLVDVNLIPDHELITRKWSGTMEFLMRHRFRQHITQELGKIAQSLNRLVLEDQEQFVLQLLHYIMAVDEEHRSITELTTIIHDQLSPEVEGTIMNLAERIKEEGRLEGKLEGQLEGELKGRLDTAQEMLNAGSDFAFIAKVTHLPLDKIKALKKN